MASVLPCAAPRESEHVRTTWQMGQLSQSHHLTHAANLTMAVKTEAAEVDAVAAVAEAAAEIKAVTKARIAETTEEEDATRGSTVANDKTAPPSEISSQGAGRLSLPHRRRKRSLQFCNQV